MIQKKKIDYKKATLIILAMFGFTKISIATTFIFYAIIYFGFYEAFVRYDFFSIWEIFWSFLSFETIYYFSLGVGKDAAKHLLNKKINENKVFLFFLVSFIINLIVCFVYSCGIPIRYKNEALYQDIFYIRLIINILVSTVAIVQACGQVIQQRNEEKLKLAEELRGEQETATRAQLNVLKLQLDPHFMFNSLGTLSGIITENPQKALDFTSRLSRIYKYIVAHINDDSIPLRDGMSFIQDYCQHIEMRYKDNFVFDIATDICHDDEEKVLPLSLQLLVENAVKHNQHSVEHPLHIRIYRDVDFVCVSNELVPYTEIGKSRADSTGIGIKNLFDRYKLLTDKIPIVLQSDTAYTVQIPIVREIRDLKKSSNV